MIVDTRFTKKVDSYVALQRETARIKSISESEIKYTLCDRSDLTNNKGNYFMSFNLPYKSSKLPTTSDLSKTFPELQQLNVDQIVIVPIPGSEYGEFIDGRTITMTVPVSGSTTLGQLSGVTLVSSTYTATKPLKSESNMLLGDNIVFLFSDDINKPYSGQTRNELGDAVDNSNNASWNPTGEYYDRPGAISYIEVQDFYNTDQRNNPNYAVSVAAGYPDNRDGYNYDIPCGFAILDKGYIVITHPQIVNNIPWDSGFTQSGSAYVDDFNVGSKTNIYFTGQSLADISSEGSILSFKELDTSFKMTSVCIALPQEFFISNNPTWDKEKAISQLNSEEGLANYDDIYITEIGLYNAFGELIAFAKLSEPVLKTYVNAITFEINLEM
jgi:hypothetical protein